MTKWTWLEWLQPDVCSYDIIVATGHSEECVQPEALSNGDNSVQLEKGRLRWKVLWSAVDHGFSASRKHQEDLVLGWVSFCKRFQLMPRSCRILFLPSQWRKNLEGSCSNLPRNLWHLTLRRGQSPPFAAEGLELFWQRTEQSWSDLLDGNLGFEINTWNLYEFVSIWPTGNGGVKPTIINLSTCCKWTKSLINPRVAQCFVVNIGGGEMLVRKDELPHGSICFVTTSQRLCWLLVTKACSFRKLHNYLIRSNLILSSTDAKSLDNWTSACQKKWRHVTHQSFLVCLFLCDDFAWWSKGIICESVLTFFWFLLHLFMLW